MIIFTSSNCSRRAMARLYPKVVAFFFLIHEIMSYSQFTSIGKVKEVLFILTGGSVSPSSPNPFSHQGRRGTITSGIPLPSSFLLPSPLVGEGLGVRGFFKLTRMHVGAPLRLLLNGARCEPLLFICCDTMGRIVPVSLIIGWRDICN